MSTEYRLKCVTEDTLKYVWTTTVPTQCPTNSTHIIDTDSITAIKKKLNKIIISKDGIGDFTSIGAAIAYNGSKTGTIFEIYPGTYVESNPLIFPAASVINTTGSPSNTIIVASNPNANIINLTPWSKIYGVALVGATDACGIYYQSSSTGAVSIVEECVIKNCKTGIEMSGPVDTLACRTCLVTHDANITVQAYCSHNGASIISNNAMVSGTPTYRIQSGLCCYDLGSRLTMTSTSINYCSDAVSVNNNGEFNITLSVIRNSIRGVVIGSTGRLSKILASSLVIQNSTTYDLDVQAMDAEVNISSGQFNENKVNNPNLVKINARYHYVQDNKKYQSFLGDIKFGSPLIPTDVSIGEGKYGTVCIILSNSHLEDGTWVDNTISGQSIDSLIFSLFQSTSIDNCCYVGSNINIYGVKLYVTSMITTPIAIDDILWEYWNGSTWASLSIMQNYANEPFSSCQDNVLNYEEKFHIRFNTTTDTNFATKTLNSLTYKWIRIRLNATISNIPSLEYIKPHTNNTKINGDGFIEHYGNSRYVKELTLNYQKSIGMTDQQLYIAQNINFSPLNNSFLNLTLGRMGMTSLFPSDIDISFGLKFSIKFIVSSNSSGNLRLTLRLAVSKVGSDIYITSGASPSNLSDCISSVNDITISSNTDQKEKNLSVLLDIHKLIPRPSDLNDQTLWISLERDAQSLNGSDTYEGNVNILSINCKYVSWCSGNHVLKF